MPKREYARKAEEERRIPVSFSLSGVRLKQFRKDLAAIIGREPSKQDCKDKASDLALHAIDAFHAPLS